MKFLVIGLGSMGKRRIRCLNAVGHNEIFGYDIRADRVEESGVDFIDDPERFMKDHRPVCLICVPPDKHLPYMNMCLENNCHFFVEASVILEGMEAFHRQLANSKIVAAPSCTLLFHPAVKLISSLVNESKLGKISNIIYHSGQYLPDWHPYEKVSEFYVSKKETGGCREIVPFELTWLCKIFGFPAQSRALFGKTIAIEGAEKIDDTYNIVLRFSEGHLMSLVVDVVSRVATRRLLVNGSHGQLRWNWEDDFLEMHTPSGTVEKISFAKSKSHAGYNPNIGEGMYIDEVRSFIEEIQGSRVYPTDMDHDIKVLRVLSEVEG